MSNPDTILTRFYGCHSVSLYGKMYCFVVMGNLFPDTNVVHRYDIKGLWVDRNVKVPSPVARSHAVIVMRRVTSSAVGKLLGTSGSRAYSRKSYAFCGSSNGGVEGPLVIELLNLDGVFR